MTWEQNTSFVLVAIPMFIFMGEVLFHSGLMSKVYLRAATLVSGVPGGLLQQADELSMLRDVGIPFGMLRMLVLVFGLGELLFALCLIAFWRSRWPVLLTVAFAVLATIGVAIASPRYLGAAFNPISLNLAILCLAIVDLLSLTDLATASNCLRAPPQELA